MNAYYKILILAIDIMMAICLGFEIKEHLEARKKNNTKDVIPEPETVE